MATFKLSEVSRGSGKPVYVIRPKVIEKYQAELVRDMKLMGCTKISDLNRNNLRFRK